MPGLKERLKKDVANISWNELQPHAKRDAIIVVTPNLDLTEVAVAIAEDNTTIVQGWIAELLIAKPTAQQLTAWNQTIDKQFTALIVQPFVLVTEVN